MVKEHIGITYGRGYAYDLRYHIVWTTKFKTPVLQGEIQTEMKDYLIRTMKDLDMEPLLIEVKPERIRLLVSAKPQLRLSDAVKILKGNTARWLFLAHPDLKEKLPDERLWAASYFVAVPGERIEEQIKHYLSTRKQTPPARKQTTH